MQRVVIDCQTGRTTIENLTPEEESARLVEITEHQRYQKVQQQGKLKRLLAKELTELREMQLQRQIFDDKDLEEKQRKISSLKEKLTKTLLS